MVENKPNTMITDYDAAIKAIMENPNKIFFGAGTGFIGIDGIVVLKIFNPVVYPTAPALTKGSEFRWV